MAYGVGVVLKEACAKQDINTIHRIISEMNTGGAFEHWNDIANSFFKLESEYTHNKITNFCNEILHTIRDYLYNRPVDQDEETNLALQILQMMLCGSESNPWPRLQFENPSN